jgi:hypothetical protein
MGVSLHFRDVLGSGSPQQTASCIHNLTKPPGFLTGDALTGSWDLRRQVDGNALCADVVRGFTRGFKTLRGPRTIALKIFCTGTVLLTLLTTSATLQNQ